MYTNAKRVTYSRAIATTTTTWAVSPPVGCTQVRAVDISVSATTTFDGTPSVAVGVTGQLTLLGTVAMGTLAGGAAIGLSNVFKYGVIPAKQAIDLTGADNTNAAQLAGGMPELLGPILITFTQGTSAGAGYADVTLDWF